MNPSDATLLLTRPRPAAERFRDRAEAACGPFAETVISPLIAIETLPIEGPVPEDSLLVFTSENGVAAGAAFAHPGRPAWCVGPRTAEAARAAGFAPKEGGGDAKALARALLAEAPQREILHLSGTHQRGDLVETLAAHGLNARRLPVYAQSRQQLTGAALRALRSGRTVVAPLFSPRTAQLLSEELPEDAPARLLLAHLSPAVAGAWQGPDPHAETTAEVPTAEGMLAAVARLLRDTPAP